MKENKKSLIAITSLYRRHIIESCKLLTIGTMSILALVVTLYVLSQIDETGFLEVYYLIPHLYLVPLILVCLWYPKSGVRLMIFITFEYFAGVIIYYLFSSEYIDLFYLYIFSGLDLAFLIAILLYVKDLNLVEVIISEMLTRQDNTKNESNTAPYSYNNFEFEANFEEIITSLRSDNAEVREDAVSRLAGITDERVILPLIYVLRDPVSSVRRSAARSLGRSNSPTAVQPLVEALSDPDRSVRDAAAESLAHLGEHSYPTLMASLSSPKWEVRVGVLVALRLTSVEVNSLDLVMLLADESHYVRREAVKTLGKVGGLNILGDLEYALQDPDPSVRLRAINAIVRHADPMTVLRLLTPFLQDEDSAVRVRVNEELQRVSRLLNVT